MIFFYFFSLTLNGRNGHFGFVEQKYYFGLMYITVKSVGLLDLPFEKSFVVKSCDGNLLTGHNTAHRKANVIVTVACGCCTRKLWHVPN